MQRLSCHARCPLEPRTNRAGTARQIRHADPGYLHPQSGAREWKARQHHPQDLSTGEPVLDLRPRAIRQAADVLARLSTQQKSGIAVECNLELYISLFFIDLNNSCRN